MSELDVQRSVLGSGSHDNSGVTTATDAESAFVPSVVGGVSGDLKKDYNVGKHITSRVSFCLVFATT